MSDELSLECRVASLVHSHFDALPARYKPNTRPNGQTEWVPLSGIVLVAGENTIHESLTCVALATGAKCLSTSQIPKCSGLVLHDSHAEILALRAFNHWLLEECKSALTHWQKHHGFEDSDNPSSCLFKTDNPTDSSQACSGSRFLRWRESKDSSGLEIGDKNTLERTWQQPFQLKNNVKIWMYCTCAPCGDASMELCMATQDDPTPWESPNTAQAENDDGTASSRGLLNGRGHFSVLGVVRRKPSRADAEPTLSKSCSDKLAAKQLTSPLSFQTSLLVAPNENAYITDLLLPEDEINPIGFERSFGDGETGRLRSLKGRVWQSCPDDMGYKFRRFRCRPLPKSDLDQLWKYAKPSVGGSKSANSSAVWTAAPSSSPDPEVKSALENTPREPPTGLREVLINGVRKGYHISSLDRKKASALSRANMWRLLREVVQLLPNEEDLLKTSGCGTSTGYIRQLKGLVVESPTYASLKTQTVSTRCLHNRSRVLDDVRSALGNWVENRGDDAWGLPV